MELIKASVPCTCTESANNQNDTHNDGMELFSIDTERRIHHLNQINGTGWHFVEIEMTTGGIPSADLEPRVGSAFIPFHDDGKVMLIGGGNHLGEVAEVWMIDFGMQLPKIKMELEEALSLGFSCRYEFQCALNKEKNKIWIFGGADIRSARNDVCYLDLDLGRAIHENSLTPSTPNELPSIQPSQRTQGSNSCIVELDGVDHLVVFAGGYNAEKTVGDGHLYLFSTSTVSWRRLDVSGSIPTPVQGHAMLNIGTKVYLYGGMANAELYDDFYVIDLAKTGTELKWNKIRTNAPYPSARAAHGMTTIGSQIFLFGGVGEHGSLCDLWKYNTESNEWIMLDSGWKSNGNNTPWLPPRLDFAMASLTIDNCRKNKLDCKKSHYILIGGGMNIMGHVFNDFWLYPVSI